MSFETFNFHPSIMAGVQALGYITPRPELARLPLLCCQFCSVYCRAHGVASEL
jgi:hypothetical protein